MVTRSQPTLPPTSQPKTKKVAAKKVTTKKVATKKVAAKKLVPRKLVPAVPPTVSLVRRARKMDRTLADTYPDAHCELDFTTPLELTVATILSAQCTDKRVNLVTPALFLRYRNAADYASADRAELESLVTTLLNAQ